MNLPKIYDEVFLRESLPDERPITMVRLGL